MARLPVPGSDAGQWGQILNDYLAQVHNGDGSLKDGVITEAKLDGAAQTKLNNVGTVPDSSITTQKLNDGAVVNAKITDDTIAEVKLAPAVRAKLNAVAPVTSVAGKTGAVSLVSGDVGLGNVDNTSDANKPVSTAVQTALNGKANTVHTHAIADVTNLQTSLNAKANTADLATVATSGTYADLSGTPAIPAQFNPIAGTNVSLSGTYPNITFNATPGAGNTDLGAIRTATDVTVTSSNGADAVLLAADGTDAGVMTAADKTKLDGIAAGAEVNVQADWNAGSGDAQILNKPTLGTAAAANTTAFATAAQGALADTAVQPAGIANFETTTQLNARDTANRDRANHTGTQAISTVTNLQSNLDAKADKLVSINAQTGTTYTLVLSDADKLVTLTNAAGITLTVPTNASVAYPIGTRIMMAQMGAGQVTIVAAGGVSVFGDPGLKIAAQYGAVELFKTATDTWLLVGRLAA